MITGHMKILYLRVEDGKELKWSGPVVEDAVNNDWPRGTKVQCETDDHGKLVTITPV